MMTTEHEYYCEIPWTEIWAEFNAWFDTVGLTAWTFQEEKLQQIITERIVHLFVSFRWHHKVWEPFDRWYKPPGTASWREQQEELKRLVQKEADFQVNR